ncbi:ALTERED PHOSPHATE STARVATION RESPONSE 1-like protein [Drosera capensis]
MGCGSSKIDDLPAVVLCRDRLHHLDAAVRHRYSLAAAHLAYLNSLSSVATSLRHFFTLHDNSAGDVDSPVLNLPPRGKGNEKGSSPRMKSNHHLSHSNSGSHLQFHSDDDSDSEGFHNIGGDVSPVRGGYLGGGEDYYAAGGGVYMQNVNYMKKQPAAAVSYEWRPTSPEHVRFGGESSNSSSYPQYYYSNYRNPSSSSTGFYSADPNPYGYVDYNSAGGGGNPDAVGAGSSKAAPPPPPPPASSAWDFLNPFESVESSYPYYAASRDSREAREEEGIPELEEEYQNEVVVKEVREDQNAVDVGKSYAKAAAVRDEVDESDGAAGMYRSRPVGMNERDSVEHEVHMVDKKIVAEEGRSDDRGNVGVYSGEKREYWSVPDAVKEIQVQFERASASGGELAKILEVGKLRYQRKHAALQVSSKMFQALTPSFPSTSNGEDMDMMENVESGSRNLSSTMQKLHFWEKKLYEEVKAEEKMRVIHDRNVQKLKRLDQRGAEAHKVDKTRTLVRSLSTKINIAIQVVDKISVKINELRDEELWPELNELIDGLARMWKAMLDCHHSQSLVVEGAKGLDAVASSNGPSDAHLEATMQLEHDLIDWTLSFSNWVEAQRDYVQALNNWLLNCLPSEPEETVDGIAPFSPGRAGAPPIFVICHQWFQVLDRISEKEVVGSMKAFAMMVFQFWERDKLHMRERMLASKDMDRKVKRLDREDMKIQKEIRALDKKIVTLSADVEDPLGNVVYQSDTRSKSNLQSGLRHVFGSMDRFMEELVKAYDELLLRCSEVVREHARVS